MLTNFNTQPKIHFSDGSNNLAEPSVLSHSIDKILREDCSNTTEETICDPRNRTFGEETLYFSSTFIGNYYNCFGDNEWNYLKGAGVRTRLVKDRSVEEIDLSVKHSYITDNDSDDEIEDEFEMDCFLWDLGVALTRIFSDTFKRLVYRSNGANVSADEENAREEFNFQRTFEHRFYNHVRMFKADSLLVRYLQLHAQFMMKDNPFYKSLQEVMIALRHIIQTKKMFDPTNPNVLVFDDELARAIGCRTLHISDVKAQVLTHMIPLRDNELNMIPDAVQNPATIIRTDNIGSLPCWADPEARSYQIRRTYDPNFDIRGYYVPSEDFLAVLHDVEDIPWNQKIFQYSQVCSAVSKFIVKHKFEVIDRTNIRVAYIGPTLLGKCFGVNYLARNQVVLFIRSQLTKAEGVYHPDYINFRQGMIEALIADWNSESSDDDNVRPKVLREEERFRRREKQRNLSPSKLASEINKRLIKIQEPQALVSPAGPSRRVCQIVQNPSNSFPQGIKTYNYLREWMEDQNQHTPEDAKRG